MTKVGFLLFLYKACSSAEHREKTLGIQYLSVNGKMRHWTEWKTVYKKELLSLLKKKSTQ